MLLAIAIACASHIAGALLGLGGRRASLSALSTFAIVSALAVVLAQLLPDALGGAGLWALVVFAAGALLPSALEKASVRLGKAGSGLGLELGYVALIVHQVADGIGLGTYAGGPHAGAAHADVMIALGAHTVPLVALVAMAYQRRGGWAVATLRVLGLLAATIAGVVGTNMVPTAAFDPAEPWVTAAVAGLLVHVVAHDWERRRGPRRAIDRLVDLAAVLAGIGLVVLGSDHHHGSEDLRAPLGDALFELSLEMAPALLIGLVIGAALSAWGSGRPLSRHLRGGPLRQALLGASIGAPLPICACGVLPVARTLRRGGAGPALVVSFLLATPELGVETFALTGRMLGWPFAFVRLAAAVLLAIGAALALQRAARDPAEDRHEPAAAVTPAGSFWRRFVASFDELVIHIAPWTVVGLVAAAYVHVTLREGSLSAVPFALELIVVTALSVPSYVCAASATPLAAVLLAKGMSPGAVLVGLLLGPVMNVAAVAFLRRSYGPRAALIGVGALVLGSWGIALGIELADVRVVPAIASANEHAHGWLAYGSMILLSIILLRSVWSAGLRGWIASLGESFGTRSNGPAGGGDGEDDGYEHEHGHGHDGHGHEHEHGHDGHGHGCDHDGDEHRALLNAREALVGMGARDVRRRIPRA